MPKLIKDGAITDSSWHTVSSQTVYEDAFATKAEQLLVPFNMWQEHKAELKASDLEIGVWLDSEDDPYELSHEVGNLPLIAVNFPIFRDGRAFSSAAILRQRLGYTGELRAIGDVLCDQAFYMKKCGINSFELPDSGDADNFIRALSDFTDSYQSTVEIPDPLFRRR